MLFNPDIPDSLSYERRLPWIQAGVFQLWHLVNPVTLRFMSFSDLQVKHQVPKKLLYSYLQFKHYFSIKSPSLSLEKPTTFELLCANVPYIQNSTRLCVHPHIFEKMVPYFTATYLFRRLGENMGIHI